MENNGNSLKEKLLNSERMIAKYEKEIEEYEKSPDHDEPTLNVMKLTLMSYKYLKKELEKDMQNPQKTDSKDRYLLPEYRSDGYFQSEDFDRKCEEFLQYLHDFEKQENRKLSREEKDILKQHFMKTRYGLDWVPEEQQGMPGVIILVD